jgi:uncharacterized protein
VSSLNPVLCDLYGLKIFVENDPSTVFRPLSIAAVVRGNENCASFSCRVWTSICGLTQSSMRICWFRVEALTNRTDTVLTDPQVDLIVQVVLERATAQSKIRAVVLVGSHARGTARPDSDIDIMLLATNPDAFRADTAWVAEIDWHAIGIRLRKWRDEEYGAAWSRRIWLANCRRQVELTFASVSWATADPIDAGTRRVISDGCRILHDPDRLLARLCKAIGREIEYADRVGVDADGYSKTTRTVVSLAEAHVLERK